MQKVIEHNARVSESATVYNQTGSEAEKKTLSRCAEGDEYKLHEFIIAECKRRGWIVFHGSMAHQTFRTKGEPDFVILGQTDDGCPKDQLKWPAVFLIECKTRTGKITPDQQAIIRWAKTLGHIIHVVRCEQEFLEVVK